MDPLGVLRGPRRHARARGQQRQCEVQNEEQGIRGHPFANHLRSRLPFNVALFQTPIISSVAVRALHLASQLTFRAYVHRRRHSSTLVRDCRR